MQQEVEAIAKRAQVASRGLGLTTTDQRNAALKAMASALRENAAGIIAANAQDMEAAQAKGTKESLLDRLLLTEGRLEDMASALEDLCALPDPLGQTQQERTLYNGLQLRRVSVPLGVVAVIYEARPNVTADAAGICLKSGNAAVLRGGSLAARSCAAIAEVLAKAAESAGMPEGSICAITSTDRAATDALMQLHGVIDVIVPRGGAGLIQHCVECSKVPVIETGTGNCHVYVHESANLSWAHDIILNAKCRRYGVCNAAETLLVDAAIAPAFLPCVLPDLAREGVLLHCDAASLAIAEQLGIASDLLEPATQYDWETEYLAPELAVRTVNGVQEAIDHINTYGTKHSEAIVADDISAQKAFQLQVDASSVYVNASTAFTDGGQFGLGAEIGISTQKLHARGPFALDALTSYKYLIVGEGQTRG